ncbi:hypothetical protein MRX96_015129 [Rhipicephalus microplus]
MQRSATGRPPVTIKGSDAQLKGAAAGAEKWTTGYAGGRLGHDEECVRGPYSCGGGSSYLEWTAGQRGPIHERTKGRQLRDVRVPGSNGVKMVLSGLGKLRDL